MNDYLRPKAQDSTKIAIEQWWDIDFQEHFKKDASDHQIKAFHFYRLYTFLFWTFRPRPCRRLRQSIEVFWGEGSQENPIVICGVWVD